MALPTNNKKDSKLPGNNQKSAAKGSKFIKGTSSKPLNVAKQVKSTGANRGS